MISFATGGTPRAVVMGGNRIGMAETIREAMRLLDMDGVECVPLYRRMPRGPLPSLVLDATAAIKRTTES